MEHPMITTIERTGYPKEMKEEAEGLDYFGYEYYSGDDIVEHNGEIILESNWQQYLEEVLGVEFKTA